ncbi:hypothetical protein GCM10011575_18340 [Microlunatus endophyticus]|uniref:DUF3618 domain-containing protein n=1 Tax=Microlunatus endophyticus TaxID=1716077 RepID=A0A917W3L7_9ACTN|nr:DUF3618 domain-containing protein [Microlunatus endophyticus]GGL60161.1 hypothetical protein GCM10011575_18340 [Microlunatus endophyticus]
MTEQTPSRAASSTPRSRAQIEADLAATRERLASSVEQLIDQVHPQRVKERQIESAKTLARAEVANLRSQVFYPNGELRTSRLAAVGGAVAGFVTFVLVVRKIVRGAKL